MNWKSWYKPFLIWFWGIILGGMLFAFLVIWLITKGALGYLPPLEELQNRQVNMFTTVFIGNSQTRQIGQKMVTPRGYEQKMMDR